MPYYGYYYGIDIYYIILVLPCILFAFWAQAKVNGTFNRFSRVTNRRGITGAQAAEAVLRQNGVTGVRIEYVAGKLTDLIAYIKEHQIIRLVQNLLERYVRDALYLTALRERLTCDDVHALLLKDVAQLDGR